MMATASCRRLLRPGPALVVLASWALSVGCDSRPGSASAWNKPAGEGLAIVDATLSRGTDYFDAGGHLAPARPYRKDEAAAFVEYGVTDWLMLVARPSLDRIAIGAPGPGSYAGLGPSTAGAQVQLLTSGPAVLALQGTAGLPGSASRSNPALIGNTDRNGEIRLLGGIGFPAWGHPGFVDVEGAYRVRSGGAATQWHADVTVGFRLAPKLLVMGQSETVVPIGPGPAWFPSARYSKLGLRSVYDLGSAVSVEAGLFTTVWGRGALRERGIRTALWYRF